MHKLLFIGVFLICFIESQAQPSSIDTLINVGNHQLHFHIVEGEGLPILFESGNGDDATVWQELLPSIAKMTGAPLITYDRAGLGQSSIDTLHISFQQEIKDLEMGLKKLGYADEVFLVSHSFGGFYSTLFAHRNKKKVKGAVYIDVALPCFFTEAWSANFVNAIAEKDWAMIKTYRTGLYYVLQNLPAISAYMSHKPFPGRIPLTLIAAENPPAMVKPDELQQWRDCLASFGNLPNHKYILAKNAGHKVWADDAELVVQSIAKLYQSVR